MTGKQLYDGWTRAAFKTDGSLCVSWSSLTPTFMATWDSIAGTIERLGPPPSAQVFIGSFGSSVAPDPMIWVIAEELVKNWAGYYYNFTGISDASDSSEHIKGDMWLFKASGIKAKVLDVAGSKLRLSINGTETDWIEVEELAKSAKKVS